MSVQKDDFEEMVKERYVRPLEMFSELRRLDISPSEMAEKYILGGVGQLSKVKLKEVRKNYASRMIANSLKRTREVLKERARCGENNTAGVGRTLGLEERASALKMDPLGGFSDDYREWLKESLVRYFGTMVECDKEVISNLAEQMNQFLSISRATSMEDTERMKRISDVLLEDNMIIRSENKGLYETGRLNNAEMISFPGTLLKLRESVLNLSTVWDSKGGFDSGLGYLGRGLMMSRDQERDVYFGMGLEDACDEKRYEMLLREDSASDLRSIVKELSGFLRDETWSARVGWKGRIVQSSRLASKFSSVLGLVSREHQKVEQTSLILDLCLRLVLRLVNLSFLLEVLQELAVLRRRVGDQLVVEVDPLVWSRLQIMSLASSFDVMIYDEQKECIRRVSNSWRDKEDIIGKPLSRQVVLDNISLFGCNVVQFHLISDSRVFNEVIQEDTVRARIEISVETMSNGQEEGEEEVLEMLKAKNKYIPTLRKFDTCFAGGRETRPPGSVFMLELCDNKINVYSILVERDSKGKEKEKSELLCTMQLSRSFVGDYLVELVTHIDTSQPRKVQICLSVLVNGEIIHTFRSDEEVSYSFLAQVTMIDEIFLEIQSCENLTRMLVDSILVKSDVIDALSTGVTTSRPEASKDASQSLKTHEASSKVRVSIGSLLVFLSGIWRGRISGDPRAIFELHSNHHYNLDESRESDDLSRILRILNEELDVIEILDRKEDDREECQVSDLESSTCLVLNLVFILKQFVFGDDSMVQNALTVDYLGNTLKGGEGGLGSCKLSPNVGKCFQMICRLMSLDLRPELEGFQWLCRITAINTLSGMSIDVIKAIFHSISPEEILSFVQGIMNSNKNEINEIIELIKCLDESDIFGLIITRLLKSRKGSGQTAVPHENPDLNSSFFAIFRELLRRNSEFSFRDDDVEPSVYSSGSPSRKKRLSIPEGSPLSQTMTDWIKVQIESERLRYSTLDWMYKYYDSYKNRTNRQPLTLNAPTYRNNCNNRIILNILTNIFVMNGIKISQKNILDLITYRFEKEILLIRSKIRNTQNKRIERIYGKIKKELHEDLLKSGDLPPNPSVPKMDNCIQDRRKRLSSSMKTDDFIQSNSPSEKASSTRERANLNVWLGAEAGRDRGNDGVPEEVLKEFKQSRDHVNNDQNIIFWREVIYQIVDILTKHSQQWLEAHNRGYRHHERMARSCRDEDSRRSQSLDSPTVPVLNSETGGNVGNSGTRLPSSEEMIKTLISNTYKDGSGIYTSEETVWFGHLLKYGITEALGNLVSYSLYCSDLLMSSLNKSEESLSSIQPVSPSVLCRIKRQLQYLLHENVVSLNLRVLRGIVCFGENFSEFSRGLFDYDIVIVRKANDQHSIHPVAESHIMFSWMLSQLFVWASIDMPVVLRDYLLDSVKESSLIKLSTSMHPVIIRNVVENLLEYKSFDSFGLKLVSLVNSKSDWMDNLLGILSEEGKRSGKKDKRSSKSLINRLIESDVESIQSLGNYWKTFHPKYENLQLAVYSVIMHLFGVDEVSRFDKNKVAVLNMSLNISRKCCSQLLSNLQAQNSSNGPENIDLQQQTKVKEKFVETTISRCKWIIENVPFNLCNRYRNPTVSQEEEEAGGLVDEVCRPGQGVSSTAESSRVGRDRKNRRATDTNIISNSNNHHIDMLKQLLSIRRRSSQQSAEHHPPMITSMGSFGVPGSSDTASVSLKLNRNNSDPSVLSMNRGDLVGPDGGCQYQRLGFEDEIVDTEITSSQVLDIYIHFIMDGPMNIQDMNKVVKAEIFSSFLKQMTLERIYKITSCHSHYRISLLPFLRFEGWLYIRLAQLVIIHEFKFRSLLELCLEKRSRESLSLSCSSEKWPETLVSAVDLEKLFSRDCFKYAGGIVSNIQEWITQIFSCKTLRMEHLHQSITENDELWFDSSLRLVILYFMIVSRNSGDGISLLKNITACIFPFICDKPRDQEISKPPAKWSPSAVDIQLAISDCIIGFLIAEVSPEDENSLTRVLIKHGYNLEQVIKKSNGDKSDPRILLFVQRLYSMSLYSVPIFADKQRFGSFYRLCYNGRSNILIFRPEDAVGTGIGTGCENGDALFYYYLEIRASGYSSEIVTISNQSDSSPFDRESLRLESLIPMQTCSECLGKDKDQDSFTLNKTIEDSNYLDHEKRCSCTVIKLYSARLRVDQLPLYNSWEFETGMDKRSDNKMGNYHSSSLNGGSGLKEQCYQGSGTSSFSKQSLPHSSFSSSSSVILLESLNKANNAILSKSYMVRLRKRGWILFKTYLLTILISGGSDKVAKERIISYTFGILTAISEKIRGLHTVEDGDPLRGGGTNDSSSQNDEVCEELGLYVEDILNVLIYSVQLTCYSARLRRAEMEDTREATSHLSRSYQSSGWWGDIACSILIKFLRLHDGEKHILKDLWTRNSNIESKISVLLTECIRQCTLKDLTSGTGQKENGSSGVNNGSIGVGRGGTGSNWILDFQETQEWILQIQEITQTSNDAPTNIRNFSVTLPDLHLFPRSFLKCISSELINYNPVIQEADSKSKDTPMYQNLTCGSSPEPGSTNTGSGPAENGRDLHPIGGNGGGNEVPSSFRNHPHSSIFIGALPNENFNVNIDGRIVQCTQASMGGGIVICRAPLTFRGLQSTGLSVPPNILSFRALGIGRFGITVAPSNVLTMSLEEVFQRNDVVGLKPHPPPSSSSSSPANLQVYQMPENMFALEIPYSEGTVIDIRYGVSSNSSGSTLRSEIFIGGESIGSVLEVQFNELAQISEDTRLSVIFVILDPLTILYEGLPFSTRYRRRSSTWFESIHGGRIVTQEQIQQLAAGGASSSASPSIHDLSLKDLDLNSKRQLLNMSFLVYIQNIKLFQEILISSHGLISGLKDNLVKSMNKSLLSASLDFETHLESFFSVKMLEGGGLDSLELSSPSEAENPETVCQLLDSLIEKTLLLCSICTIFGIDLNPLEDQEGERGSFPSAAASPSSSYKSGVCSSSHFERDLLLRRRCSNVTYGDLPWLSSSIDSGVLCYSSLFGLKISHLELILEGFYQLFKVRFIHRLYFLLGTENLKITISEDLDNCGKILELQKHLLDSLSVLVSRSLLVVSLISRVVLEFSPGNGGPQLPEKMKDILFGFFSLISNFSLYSCGETSRRLESSGESNLFDIFSVGAGTAPQVEESETVSSFKSMRTCEQRNLFNIIASTGVECEQTLSSSESSQTRIKDPSELVAPERLYDLPEIRMRTILPTQDCNILWRWISRQRFIMGWNSRSQSLARHDGIKPIRHLDNSIYGKLSMSQRIFNLEGSNPMTAKKLVLKSNGTMAIWSIKISAIDTLCNICGIIPDHINRLMFQGVRRDDETAPEKDGIPDKQVISERFYQIIRIMRICTYFIIRGREDFVFPAAHQNMDDNNHLSPSPDYWLMFKRSIYNDIHNSSEISIKESTRKILDKIDSESVLTDKLYSWQRLIYITACYLDNDQDQYHDLGRNPYYDQDQNRYRDPSSPWSALLETERAQIREIISNFLKTEVTFHLVGSLIQIFSIRVKDSLRSSQSPTSSEKQLKYSSLSPSVYVAHWLMDQFIRHPLCPSFIRSSIVNRLTWNFLFSLLTNGVHIPTKLAIDSCRMTYWIVNNNGMTLSGTLHEAQDRDYLCSEEMTSQAQGILDSICYCVSCILSLYESKVNFDGENPLANVNNLPVFRELVLGKVPITQLGWDYFTSAEDYKPINRQKINTTLVCHFMACSARCILDSSDKYTLIPLPHILSFFNKYLSFISISNHLMLSTCDTSTVSDHEISKIRTIGETTGPLDCVTYDEIFNNEIKPNTLFPWRYIQSALNYISSKNMLLSLGENPVCQEYHSVLRINFGSPSENDLVERSKRKGQTQGGNPHQGQNYVNYQLSKLHRRSTGFIGFKLKPVKLEFDHLRSGKVPRILYSIHSDGINGLIYEYGGYEMGQPGVLFREVVKHSYDKGGELLAEKRSRIGSHKFRVVFDHEAESTSHCLRCSRPLYVNGLHSSNVNILFHLSKSPESLGDHLAHPIRMILVGGLVFDRHPSEKEISRFHSSWIQNELLQKLKPRRRDASTRSEPPPAECNGYLGSILYSYYDDHCLTFGGEEIPNTLTRIRASPDFSIQARTLQSSMEISMLFQNRIFTLEVNGTPVANAGLPPQARFLFPVVYIESSLGGGSSSSRDSKYLDSLPDDDHPLKMHCDIQLKDCLSDVFIPHTQIVSKISYLPVLSKKSLSLGDCQGEKDLVKWVPAEFKHRFRVNDPKTGGGCGGQTGSGALDNSLTTLVIQPVAKKGDGPDYVSSESSTPPRLDSSRSRGRGGFMSVLGYMHPSIPSGISLCSSTSTSRDIYNPTVFNNWKNWILPESSVWTVKRSEDEDVLQTQNGNDDECYSNDSGEINIKSRLFKSLDPCKSFSVTFRIRQPEGGGPGGAPPRPFGLGIDWLDGMYRFVWLSDGRFVVPSLPPLPFEISKLYKEYKIPANHQVVIQGLQPCEASDSGHKKVSVPQFGLNDKITMEFQPSIPALVFFKNDRYSFSFNFTLFYQKICGSLSLCLDEQTASVVKDDSPELIGSAESLSEKEVWIVRTLFVMAILQNDVFMLSRLISKNAKYLIDLKAGEFLFKLLITEDLYNNILNCIPKCISSSKFTIRSLLSNIYNYLMFPDPREFYSEQDQTFNWSLLHSFFSISTEAELDSSSSHKVFPEKRTQKVVKHETPFWLACWIGNEHVVQYLLKFVHVDNRALNLLSRNDQLSLYVGCFGMVSEAREGSGEGPSSSPGAPRAKCLIQTENRRRHLQEEKPDRGASAPREWKGEPLFQTGLMASIISGNARIAYILMALYDSDVNIQDMQGNTSYHFAVAFGHLDIIQLLSFKGVNPYIMNISDQFAGSLYRTILKRFIDRDRSQRGAGLLDHTIDAAGSEEHQGSSSSPVSGSGDKMFEWEMTPSPPNIRFHGEREGIAEFTQQYEKLYCFSVCGGESVTAAKDAQKQPFINLSAQNKSNLLPPYFYPWPGLFSDCQIVAVLDQHSPPPKEEADTAAVAYCISIESLEIGGILHGGVGGRSQREETAESSGQYLQLVRRSNESGQKSRLADRMYDQRKVNIHIIQHLFYRWIRSIRCNQDVQASVSGCLSPNSIASMSINRRPETGRPMDDILYNVNSISYYHYAQMAAITQQSGGAPGGHFGFDPLGILPPLITSSSSGSQPVVVGGGALGTHSGYRMSQHRGGPVSTADEQQAPSRLGVPRSSGRGALFEIATPAADKVVITQEVMEEIYSGLSQVRDIEEILDIIHVIYKYIVQVLTVKCSMGGGGSTEVVFPKNAGICRLEQSEGTEDDRSSGSVGVSETSEKLLQERMIKCCWELLEMEKSIDRNHGYYPYWAIEHERLIWIHNVRRLLSLVSSDRDNSLDYITCNSWIEWMPNLELFDKSLYSKYKKSLASEGRRSLDSSRASGGKPEEQSSLDFVLLARPVISLDMIILCKIHQHCQTSIDQKLVQLLNVELNEQQIYRVVLFELLRQINFADKPEFEQGGEFAGSAINPDEIRNKSMSLLGIKTLDITKMIPKHDSGVWSRTKLSHSDCLDMIRFISNAIKNLFAIVLLKYFLNKGDQVMLTAKPKVPTNTVPVSSYGNNNNLQVLEKGGGPIDLNSLYYSEEEFPFRVIDILLSKVLPIYTTSLDVFTKIQLNCASGNKNVVKLRLQSMFWYVDIMKQFLSGRILLLNKFNDISRCTIPMISGVFNSPTLSYEQEDFLRIPSSFYFYNNYFGDLFWKVNKQRFMASVNYLPLNHSHSSYDRDGAAQMITRRGDDYDEGDDDDDGSSGGGTCTPQGQRYPDFVLETPLLLLQSSRLLGSWGSYYNIYSSPRYLIHVGPYDIPIPISSYLLLKPYYKLSLVNSLWNDILKKLIDSKKRDANGNSTANNGLTVHLNRNLAVTGGNPLKYSLLSQSTRQILQMLPEKLRITERPFLVVFRGEGSTDFGGPFQEFLSWISNEIMSKNSDNIDKTVKEGNGWHLKGGGPGGSLSPGHLSSESEYYGLFTPCANALHSIGHNQDAVSINSIYSSYRTTSSLYVCEEFLLFGSGEKEERLGLLEEESLLSRFKREYYDRNSLVSDHSGIGLTQDHGYGFKMHEGGGGLAEKRYKIFRSVVSKIPSLRCHHNNCHSGNSKILTNTVESKVATVPSSFRRGQEQVDEKNIYLVEDDSAREDSVMLLRSTESGHLLERGASLSSLSSSLELDSRTQMQRRGGEVGARADSRQLGSTSSLSPSSATSSPSPASMGSIPEELNNTESINNTNPTPINTQQEADQPSNSMVEDLGIMHRLDPWEWPKDKEIREIIGEMYECLGRLMGICVTTKSAMNINLNPLIWKKFSGLPLSLKDLADADCIAYEMLNSLKSIENENLNRKQRMASMSSAPRCGGGRSSRGASIPEIEGLTFQIENMNGSITSLLNMEGDADSTVGVTLDNLHLFVQLAERCRMLDDVNIMTNILKGFGTIIPLGRMRMLFNYQKIEYLICGESRIDLTVLKNHTVSPHPELKEQLFQVLENFNNEQLQKLLRFVSGRSRLPQVGSSSSDWKFSINYDNPDTIQDNRLPIATTCGFRLSLPRYSSIEILRSRLLYAINNCVAIDLDAYVTHDR